MHALVIQIERTEERVADTCAFAKSPVRIGRNPLCDLQLDESFVSQWHGVIRFDDERTTFVDLGSTNPTLVDGQPVPRNVEVTVSENTDIRIGTLRLHLLRVPSAPEELFGARRKTSFARANGPAFNNAEATMFLGKQSVPVAAVAQLPSLPPMAPVPGPPPVLPSRPPLPNSPSGRSQSQEMQRDPPCVIGLPGAGTPSAAPAPARSQLPAADSHSYPAARPSARPSTGSREIAVEPGFDALYRDYQGIRKRLLAHVRTQLEAEANGPAREAAFDRMVASFPELGHEPELRALAGKLGLESWRTGVPDMNDWLRRLTGGLFPPVGVQPNGALALERIGEVLEVFSAAFIELRNAHEQFCDEMSLDKPPEESLLNTTKNPKAVLAYLLNPDLGKHSKVTDLARAMAEYAVHQVALVSAVVEGARDVLQSLSPAALTGRSKPGASFIGKLVGSDQRALWTKYVSAFDETMDEDHFTRKLFGRSFARKYYAITGGRRSLPHTPT
jgi:predicted component of type VI protein secretion system